MRPRQATMVYHLFDHDTVINLARTFYTDIIFATMDKKGRLPLPYGRLITSFLKDAGIVPPQDLINLPKPFGQESRTRSEKQLQLIRARRGDSDNSDDEAAAEQEPVPDEDVEMEEGEEAEYDEAADPDYVPVGTNLTERVVSLETRFDGFMTSYQRDTSMMLRMQDDLYRLLLGPDAPLPTYFYDPYDPSAPGSSHPPPAP